MKTAANTLMKTIPKRQFGLLINYSAKSYIIGK